MTGRELKEVLFFPSWWKALLLGVLCGILLRLLTGCSTPISSGDRYPEYDKWWTQSVNTNSFEGLGQGDVYVHEFVTTNLVLSADGLHRKIVTNRTEVVLL